MTKTNMKLYDFDACLAHALVKKQTRPKTPLENWIIDTNQAFFDQQIAEIKAQGFKRIIIGFGTNRQDWHTDVYNAKKGNGTSCARALPIIQHYLQQHLKDCEVKVDLFWRADLDGDCTAGTNVKQVLQALMSNTFKADDSKPRYIFDIGKASLLFAHAQRAVDLNPDDDIVIDFYDDHPGILSNLSDFFQANNHLLSTKVVLNIHQYQGGEIIFKSSIKGVGEADPNYKWSTCYLTSTGILWETKDNEPKNLDFTLYAELLDYHNICKANSSLTKVNSNTFDKDKFKLFLNEIPKLATTTGQEKSYTTAMDLIKEGLLPANILSYVNEKCFKEEKIKALLDIEIDEIDAEEKEFLIESSNAKNEEKILGELIEKFKEHNLSFQQGMQKLYEEDIDINISLETFLAYAQKHEDLTFLADFKGDANNSVKKFSIKNSLCSATMWSHSPYTNVHSTKKSAHTEKQDESISLSSTENKVSLGV